MVLISMAVALAPDALIRAISNSRPAFVRQHHHNTSPGGAEPSQHLKLVSGEMKAFSLQGIGMSPCQALLTPRECRSGQRCRGQLEVHTMDELFQVFLRMSAPLRVSGAYCKVSPKRSSGPNSRKHEQSSVRDRARQHQHYSQGGVMTAGCQLRLHSLVCRQRAFKKLTEAEAGKWDE